MVRTNRTFSWTASTLLTWSWPTLPVTETPVFNPPVVVGRTIWIITDDGRVTKRREQAEVRSGYLIADTSIANIPRP